MPAPCTSVVLVARSRAVRERLRTLLAGDQEVVGEACHRWEAGELIRAVRPDVAVVDVALLSTDEFFLAGWGPISHATRIVAAGPPDPELERRLRAMGAADYRVLGASGRRIA